MLCPSCRSEFVPGMRCCPDCQCDLVAELPRPTPAQSQDPELVTVLRSTHAECVAVAKSLLIEAGIQYGVRGEEVQDLFGYGRFPSGNSLFMGPIEIQVAAQNASEAGELLALLRDDAPDMDPGEAAGAPSSRWAAARKVGKVVAALMLIGLGLELLLAVVLQFTGG